MKPIKIAGDSRNSWRLEFTSEMMNQTFHYDMITGILLDAEVETTEGSIGQAANIIDQTQDPQIVSHQQVLISTNAWESSKTTDFPTLVIVLCLVILMDTKKRKYEQDKRNP